MALKRIVQIDCTETKGDSSGLCRKCRLPVDHHGMMFRILKHDDVYDVYSLNALASAGSPSTAPLTARSLVLHVSGPAFAKFKEYA